MCGICGIIGHTDRKRIEQMVLAMGHRGPDDSGILYENGIAMGMARLAIIDITTKAHQPMSTPDELIWIVYNGETYNFKEEREILSKKGYVFRSTSDVEVVLRMYEEYGDDFLLRMRGIFALAIYDKRMGLGKERFLLARDHLGVKPLLYAKIGSAFIFASEMKSMLASGLIERQFDPEALRLLLTYGSISQPMTAVSGIKMLLPGHRLIIEHGKERLDRFWKLGIDRFPDLRKTDYEEQVRIIRDSLEESVRLQMVSDVPIGAFLSGGVDSSLLVALMSLICSNKVNTFSVGFEQEGLSIDETDDAQRIAKFIGTDHKRVLVTGADVRNRIEHIAYALDQPTVDGVNSYFVSLAARKAVTVAISGTGGDELFAGYPWFRNMAVLSYKDKQNSWLSSSLRKLLSHIARLELFNPLSQGYLSDKLERARVSSGFVSRYARQYQIFGVNGTSNMLNPEIRRLTNYGRDPVHDMKSTDELSWGTPIERVSALCLRGYTQNQLMRDIDAVSMSHSLEVRVPFLDHLFIDMALSLPDNTKLKNINSNKPFSSTYRATGSKKILIDASDNLLPPGMDLQQKRGFGMPFDSWLRGPLKDVMDDTLSSSTIKKRGFFNGKEVESVREKFLSSNTSWVYPWLLMITELWCREVLDRNIHTK